MENKKLEQLTLLKEELAKMEDKTFNVYFFTVDSKGVHSGYLAYVYETAYHLKKLGYNVHMLHQEPDFVGVESWMGEEYASLPHHNIEKEKINLSLSDILFIPELFSNVMRTTDKAPCKRIVILQNFDYLTQIIPAGQTWMDFGIKECVSTTAHLEERVKSIFPRVKTHVVPPIVNEAVFNAPTNPKKLIINVVAKNSSDVNNIVKPFFWKYPMYRWVAFRELKGLSRADFADALKEAAFTVWVDYETNFGYSALEAMRCGSIVIGKVPEVAPKWMVDGEEFVNNGVWYYNNDDVHMLIAGAIESFIKDGIHPDVYENMKKTNELYTTDKFVKNLEEVYVNGIFETHKNSLKLLVSSLENINKEE